MPFVDTNQLPVIQRLPGWQGRYFHSAHMTFAHYDFTSGASIHEHFHPEEEVYEVVEGELESQHRWRGPNRPAGPGRHRALQCPSFGEGAHRRARHHRRSSSETWHRLVARLAYFTFVRPFCLLPRKMGAGESPQSRLPAAASIFFLRPKTGLAQFKLKWKRRRTGMHRLYSPIPK